MLTSVVNYLKTKSNFDTFDLGFLQNWSPAADKELCDLIDNHKLCCVAKTDCYNGRKRVFRIDIANNLVRHDFDPRLLADLREIKKQCAAVLSNKNNIVYSIHIREILNELNDILTLAFDQRLEFMNLNQDVMLAVCANSLNKIGLDESCLVGKTILKIQLPELDLIDELVNMQSALFSAIGQ